MARVVIFLPGTLGSEIILNGSKIWPGSITQYLTGFSEEDLTKLLDPAGVAGDIIRNFAIVPQYSALVDFLGDCGFHEQGSPPNLYICAYDWRKSNREAAQTLAAKVTTAVRDHAGAAEITLITHSMGGLVARHYLESGDFDGAEGFKSVTNLYTLATPHLGAPIAVLKALGLDKTIFLSGAQIKRLAADPNYPSLYELFPQRGQPVVWDAGSTPVFQTDDLFGGIGAAAGLDATNLQAADRFHQTLQAPASGQGGVRYFFFSGTQKKTTINLMAASAAGHVVISKRERDDAGDGTVPIWSSRFGLHQTEYCGGEHSEIYKDFQLKQTLKQLLVPVTALEAVAVPPPSVVVTITELVLRPKDWSQLDINLAARTSKLAGKLVMEKAVLGADESLQGYQAVGETQAIAYEGPAFDRLRIQFTAPGDPGIYRVTFTTAEGAEGSDQFFVQAGSGS